MRRTGKVRHPQTDVLPLCYATKLAQKSGVKFHPIGATCRPCVAKKLKIALWVITILVLCAACIDAGKNKFNKETSSNTKHNCSIFQYIILTFAYLVRPHKLEYLAVYGRTSMGVPVGELQATMAPTTDYCLLHLQRLGLWHIFLSPTETGLSHLAACERRD